MRNLFLPRTSRGEAWCCEHTAPRYRKNALSFGAVRDKFGFSCRVIALRCIFARDYICILRTAVCISGDMHNNRVYRHRAYVSARKSPEITIWPFMSTSAISAARSRLSGAPENYSLQTFWPQPFHLGHVNVVVKIENYLKMICLILA